MINEPYRTNILKFLTVVGVIGYAIVAICANEKAVKAAATVSKKNIDSNLFLDMNRNTNTVGCVSLEKQNRSL